jgi:alpha/beta superfamily hydrolase
VRPAAGSSITTFVSAARAAGPEPQVAHGFFDGPRPLFGSYHVPRGAVRDIAYVICPPLGWEGIQFYETARDLAAELAAGGFHALRLHYDGIGESIGADEDPDRVAAWLESVRRACAAMAAVPGVAGVGVVAVRVGALLAATVAADTALASMVLWEPCVAGAHYTREMEILASAAPSALQGGRERVPGIEAGGYLITPETIASLDALDLMKVTPKGAPPVLVAARDDRPPLFAKKLVEHLERGGSSASLEQLPGYKEAMTYPERAVPATAALRRICAWAGERSKTIDAASAGRLALREEAVDGGVRHRPIRFGPSQRIFGVISEPVEPRGAKHPVLVLTGGVVPRTGVNRMNVALATRLAQRGHTCLRIDVSGICESPAAEGGSPNDPHAASLLPDVRAAVDLLLASTGAARGGSERSERPRPASGDTIALIGLCSGAYATFQTALADARVRGAVLLNPEVFHLKEGTTKFSETEQSNAAKHYRQSLTSFAAWKKLLTGKANVRYIAGFVGARVKSTVARARDRISARIKKVPQGVAGDLHGLLERGTMVGIVLAENDPGYDPLMKQIGGDLDMLRGMGLRWKVVPGPDHTFNDISVRRPLVDWLVELLAEA